MAQLVAMDAAVAVTRVPASAAVASTSASRHSVVSAGAVSCLLSFFFSLSLCRLYLYRRVGLGGLCGVDFESSGLRCGCLVWLSDDLWRSCGDEDFRE